MRNTSRYRPLKKHRNGQPVLKLRVLYALVTGVMVLLGLGSRHFAEVLPHFVVFHAGDALWAAGVYFTLRLLYIEKPAVYIAFFALLISFAVETSQLYQAGWINKIRQTLPGALILGHGFLWVDLLRYTGGILLAWCVDKVIISVKRR